MALWYISGMGLILFLTGIALAGFGFASGAGLGIGMGVIGCLIATLVISVKSVEWS